jgi:hydroxymethylglutaryl-CoA reductase
VEDGHLVGRIELPMSRGTVGGPIKVHPGVQVNMKLLRVESAREMSMVFAAVGLAQNFAAVRALGSIGIQKGHMALHARCVAVTAGARGDWVEKIAELLVTAGHVKVEKARELIASLSEEDFRAATGTEG